MVNNINISVGSIIAANGILHVIDIALMPPSADLVIGNRSVSTYFLLSVNVASPPMQGDLQSVLRSNGFTRLRQGIRVRCNIFCVKKF